MSTSILFLAVRMRRGFGVSVVVEQIARRLLARGLRVTIGCVEHDDSFGGLDLRTVADNVEAVQALARQVNAHYVIAHTSPYFEMLPGLREVSAWAWEHGDPDPEFFESDADDRRFQQARKREAVYPSIDGVIAISHFVRSQIHWPAARIIHNGWQHVLDALPINPWPGAGTALRVGCLMRLGAGEERYKGGRLFLEIAQRARECGLAAEFAIMGRGTAQDARRYAAQGLRVFANASDAERDGFLRHLDVFVSPSLWEGCNLPLIEAQALGTPSIAFDTGAHPEYASILCGSVDEVVRLLRRWAEAPELRHAAGAYAKRHVVERFSWDRATDALLEGLSDFGS